MSEPKKGLDRDAPLPTEAVENQQSPDPKDLGYCFSCHQSGHWIGDACRATNWCAPSKHQIFFDWEEQWHAGRKKNFSRDSEPVTAHDLLDHLWQLHLDIQDHLENKVPSRDSVLEQVLGAISALEEFGINMDHVNRNKYEVLCARANTIANLFTQQVQIEIDSIFIKVIRHHAYRIIEEDKRKIDRGEDVEELVDTGFALELGLSLDRNMMDHFRNKLLFLIGNYQHDMLRLESDWYVKVWRPVKKNKSGWDTLKRWRLLSLPVNEFRLKFDTDRSYSWLPTVESPEIKRDSIITLIKHFSTRGKQINGEGSPKHIIERQHQSELKARKIRLLEGAYAMQKEVFDTSRNQLAQIATRLAAVKAEPDG